ncbi:MAG TPA: ABC transporter permease [Parachlamydiales bacterium]|nr:ABC transporter permease [Parachlamydiales bacterium]
MWLSLSIKNLFRNFRRTVAILCTVALGTGALFSFDGFIHGVLEELRDTTIHANYGYGQIHTKAYRGNVFEEPTKHWISHGKPLEDFLYGIDGVNDVFPRVGFSALLKHGSVTVSSSGQGVEAEREAKFFHSLNIEEGSALTTERNGILLGHGLARALRASPGDEITVIATSTKGVINKDKFVVTGIFYTGSVHFDSRVFRIQLPAAQHLLKTSRIESIALGLKHLSDWDFVESQIETYFPDLEATPFHVLDKINYQHSVDWLKAQFNVVQIIILSIVLLGIFNSLSASILERKQEIGNLRANGESVFQVMRLIMTEGFLLAIFGSLLGMGTAYSLLMLFINKGLLMPPGPGQTRQFLVTFSFTWSMVSFSLLLSSIAAIFASFLAGIKVAKMSIAKSLRAH